MADRMVRAMRADGVRVDFLPINPQPPGPLRFAERVKGLRTLAISACYIRSLLANVPRYDVVHLFSASYLSFIISQSPAILISRMFGKPIILNYRSGQAEDHLRRWGRSVFWLLRMVDRIVTPSAYLVDVFGRFGFDASYVYNVIDPSAVRYRLRTRAAPRIIVPRSLEPLYNVECAIRAFQLVQEKFPRASLTVLGDGSQRDYLEALVAELGLRDVQFTGRVERNEIGDYYDRHDVLVNTTSIDNMPVSLLEGFAAGLPMVTTDAGGIPYLVSDRVNAHVVPVNDHVSVAHRIIELLESPSEVERLSRLGKTEVQKYQWNGVREDWYQLYRDVREEHGQQRRPPR